MHAQLIPSDMCEEAAGAFESLLKGRASVSLNDEYFVRDWSSLWDEIVRDGWTVIADGPTGNRFSLLDLSAFAQVWGRYLVPLPFVPTIAVRRALGDASASIAPSSRLSYGIAEEGTVLVPLGHASQQVLSGSGLVSIVEPAGIDDWAASAPITVLDNGTAPADRIAAVEAAILAVAEAIGAAGSAMDRAVEYAKLREQFGQPIGRFQAVKHRLANMHCRRELAISALSWACFESQNASRAVRVALEQCLLIVEEAVQVHGGIGFTWEAAVHRYYRHVMAMRRLAVAATREAVI
jgi:hypothetical protein